MLGPDVSGPVLLAHAVLLDCLDPLPETWLHLQLYLEQGMLLESHHHETSNTTMTAKT